MTPFVSVHIISKEVTNLGVLFLDGALTSLVEAQFPNEVIVIDNGSFDPIFDLYQVYKNKFKDFDCQLKIVKSEASDFGTLRNQCIEHTNPITTWTIWQDTDEVYYEEDLDTLKNYELVQADGFKEVWPSFFHFIRDPFNIQVNTDCLFKKKEMTETDIRIGKDNTFRYNKNMRWVKEKKVHERVDRDSLIGYPNTHYDSNCRYLHLGYARKQVETMVKWLHYAVLEFGNVNCYKKERVTYDKNGVEVGNQFEGQEGYETKTVDYLRNWRDPFNIIFDRIEHCIPYPNAKFETKQHLPQGFMKIIDGCKTSEDWFKKLDKLDPPKFELEWRDKFKELGTWEKTLDFVVDEMNKRNWNIYK